MSQGSGPAVPDDAAVVENFLEFSGGGAALSSRQVSFSAHIDGVEAGEIQGKDDLSVLELRACLQRRLQRCDGPQRLLVLRFKAN